MIFLKKLEKFTKEGKLTPKQVHVLTKFQQSYKEAVVKNGHSIQEYEPLLQELLDRVIQQIEKPYPFELYHQSIRTPFDYYQFGLEILRPLVIFEKSRLLGIKNLDRIQKQLAHGSNVIFLANHQTEPDPQAISLLLEKTHSKLAEEIIFVAGHRVIKDPMAVPFSLGCNLLCIYSKKYIDHPPEKKQAKLLHNAKTMKQLIRLLNEGGKCIYVAPSGGRDRPNAEGVVEVARFDPQSIEMFWLMSQQAERLTHFYPLALETYALLPPPNSTEKELGEKRQAQCTPIHMAFGEEIDMEHFPCTPHADKRQRRKARADYIWEQVKKDYARLKSF
jgi:glycerol-3-phosphate O-acyltransferase